MADSQIAALYQRIFQDLNLDSTESQQLQQTIAKLNPPPDKLTKLRASAFKVACNFLSADDPTTNEKLLRTIESIVTAIEDQCMDPHNESGRVTLFDEDDARTFYTTLFDGYSVDMEESEDLVAYFSTTNPPTSERSIGQARAMAFKVGMEKLTDSIETNIQILRCINVIIHALETTCYRPKSYTLQIDTDKVDNLQQMTLTQAAQYLWDTDSNRLTPNGDDYTINVGAGKKPYWKEDSAHDPLFTMVDKAVWKRPTYAAFVRLLDNYVATTGTAESIQPAERTEVIQFLHAIMETLSMQFCQQYCVAHNVAPSDRDGFITLLTSIWFELYRRERGGNMDSSGFEHVFIGEVNDNNEVSGFHNWIQFYLEEQKGALDYRGYIKPRGQGRTSSQAVEHDESDHVLTFQFAWKGVEKFVGTSFVGVSPEFEMALYTMCFLLGREENHIELDTGDDTYEIIIKCYTMAQGKIGTTFPEISQHYEE